jgi:hypothetical protein
MLYISRQITRALSFHYCGRRLASFARPFERFLVIAMEGFKAFTFEPMYYYPQDGYAEFFRNACCSDSTKKLAQMLERHKS